MPIYPYVGKPGWNLTTAMADEAIDYVNRIKALSPDQSGATHAPHHPTKEWVQKISEMKLFDQCWNKLRATILPTGTSRSSCCRAVH